jgi:phosphoglycolate phosphatase/pyrophosphatase PpaX
MFGPTEEQIIAHLVDKDLVQPCLNTYYKLYEREHDRIYVYLGINELLKAVQKQGIPMALCTGKSRRAVEISLKRLAWNSYFQAVITGDDTKRFKPDPEGLNLILGHISAARKKTIFIGDGTADIAAARNAGILSGHAQWGVPGHTHPVNVHSDYQFATPQAIIDLFMGTAV